MQAKDKAGEHKRLKEIIDTLRNPAGERFNQETPPINREEFIEAFHAGIKNLHYSLIEEIIVFEKIKEKLKEDKAREPRNRDILSSLKTINEMLMVWRRANDAIAWIIVGFDKNTIKRLSYDNPRSYLKDQNPRHVMEVLTSINESPMNLAIWNDATSCIDVGDITLLDKKENTLTFIELKEGKVNEAIQNVKQTGCERAAYYLFEQYGKKAIEQLKRSVKQEIKYAQSLHLLKDNKGIDPILQRELAILELAVPDEDYFPELDDLINEARVRDHSIRLIDDCIWAFAALKSKYSKREMIDMFSNTVMLNEGTELKEWLKTFGCKANENIISPVANIWMGMELKDTLPIFLYDLSTTNVHDLIFGQITVLSFIAWHKFAPLIKKHGMDFEWSSKKEGRREKANLTSSNVFCITDKIPTIIKDGDRLFIGPGYVKRMLFDGIRPSCIAKQSLEFMEAKVIK